MLKLSAFEIIIVTVIHLLSSLSSMAIFD